MTLYIHYHLDSSLVEVDTTENNRGHESCKIGQTHVRMDAGQPVLVIDNGRWKEPPKELAHAVLRVSIKSISYNYEIDRAAGLYRLGEAEAYVDRISRTRDHGAGNMVEVTAPNKESALALWDQIHRGDIRPYDEMNREQIPPLIDDDTMQEVRQQAALLARRFLKEEMTRLVEVA